MKAISPLDQNDQARAVWEQGQAAAERAHLQTTQDPTQAVSAAPPVSELPVKPADTSNIYPTFDVTSHTPPSTGSVSHAGMAQPRSVALDKRPWWITVGVYLIAASQLIPLVLTFISGESTSLLMAIAHIATALIAFGLMSWRNLARVIFIALSVVVLATSAYSAYLAQSGVQKFQGALNQIEEGSAGFTDKQRAQLDQLHESGERLKHARNQVLVSAAVVVLLSGGPVIFLFLPRVRSEFS